MGSAVRRAVSIGREQRITGDTQAKHRESTNARGEGSAGKPALGPNSASCLRRRIKVCSHARDILPGPISHHEDRVEPWPQGWRVTKTLKYLFTTFYGGRGPFCSRGSWSDGKSDYGTSKVPPPLLFFYHSLTPRYDPKMC